MLAVEHRRIPRDTDLREAHVRLAGEHRRRRELDVEHTSANEVVARRRDEVTVAAGRVAEFASDVGLPTGETELAEVREAVTGYRLVLAELWPAAGFCCRLGRRHGRPPRSWNTSGNGWRR
jgi:hypothetical protein